MLAWWANAGITDADLAMRRPGGAFLWARAAPLAALPLAWARAENAHGADIYIRPARGADWPLLFLDDVSVERALSAAHEHAALVVRTSPEGGCHLWLRCSRALDERARARAQRHLAARLDADRASTSGEHLGRLAGFKNWKRGGVWVNVLATPPHLPLWEPDATALAPQEPRPRRKGTTRLEAPDQSESAKEWGWVMGALGAGCAPSWVEARLRERALRRGADAARYARLTVERALQASRQPAPTPAREDRL
jgi:hypothetical protein